MLKRKYRYMVLGFITVVIFSTINISLIKFNLLYQSNKNRIVTLKKESIITEEKEIENSNDFNQNNIISKEIQPVNSNWKIIIPKIKLEADISQGTSPQILEKYVGHFEDSSKFEGNIGLAAHNNTFFKNLKNIEIGDEIIYESEYGKKQYKVTFIQKIQETDWSMLTPTKENKITLITCVKNMPQLRLCVQATEIKN